jgi:Peptidase M15
MKRFWLFAAQLCLAAALLATAPTAQASVSGNGGLNRRLNNILYQISNHFRAPVSVISGCRSYAHNRRIGGARESWHLRCMAADIRVQGVGSGAVYRYVASMPGRGGVGTYCRESFIHVDVGDRREWHWGCHGERRFHSPKGSYNHMVHHGHRRHAYKSHGRHRGNLRHHSKRHGHRHHRHH